MGKNIVEKIMSEHSGKDVRAGDYSLVNLDLVHAPDGGAPRIIDLLRQFGMTRLWNPSRAVFIIDHCTPAPRAEMANWHKKIREFAHAEGAMVFMM